MTNYPTTLDDATSLPVESASTALSVNHVTAHQNVQDAIEAIEAKVGVDSSAVTTSHDYKLSAVTGSDKALKSGTSTQSVTGLTLASPKITVGSDAVGDLHYVSNVDGTQSRLAKGNDNQILKMNGTALNWEDEITTVNASTTVAGIVELATAAEINAGTATGGVGPLVVTPDQLDLSGIVQSIFGGGGDGAYTFSDQGTAPTGTTKTDNTAGATIFRLDRDIYCTNITINATVTVNPNGYRLFANGTLTVNGSIKSNGGNGGNASGSTGGTAGAAAHAQGTIPASFAGIAGGDGGTGGNLTEAGDGSAGVTVLGSIGVSSSDGGTGGTAAGQAGGNPTAATATPIRYPRTVPEALTLVSGGVTLASMYMLSSPGAPGGGGGTNQGSGAPPYTQGGGGGGGGASGGFIAIYGRTITVGAAGAIQSLGGNGGNGANANANGGAAEGGGGGTGAGGSGGVILLVYRTYTNSGSVVVTGGTKGATVGTGVNSGTSGSLGSDGVSGVIYTVQA